MSDEPITLIDASTTGAGCLLARRLSWVRCAFESGVTSPICARRVRICSMTASGVSFSGVGEGVPGVLLSTGVAMTFSPYASCQAGGCVHDSSTSASGHRLEVAATRRYFRLMFSRGVYTPQEPAAGGENSTPAPVQG